MSALGLAVAATRPRAERPWWLRRPGMLAIGALVLFATALGALTKPDDAQAVGLPDLSPTHWAVKGLVAILMFLFGDDIKQFAGHIVDFLLRMPDVTNRSSDGGFLQLNRFYDLVGGAAWALLSLAFIAAVLQYWSSSYTANGADTAARAFGRTIGGIGMLVSLPAALHLVIEAMNALTDGLLHNPVVGPGISETLKATLTIGLSNGGIALLIGVAALVAAVVLLITKIVTAALLAVLFVLAPLAIGVWPFEPLAWPLKTLASAALALLVFPVVWAVSFGVFAVLAPTALTAGTGLEPGIVTSLIGLATLIIAFKLPFAVLRLGMGAGLLPSPSRGLQTMYYARSAAAALAA